MLRVLLATLTCCICGCSTTSLVPEPVSAGSLNERDGILVGSFARDPLGRKYYSQTFIFKNIGTDEIFNIKSQPTFNIFSGKTRDDFQTQDSHGSLFIFALPAGEYTYHSFSLYQSTGNISKWWSPEEDFSIPFEIVPNRVNYAGEIKLIPVTGKNLFGWNVQDGGFWLISNQRDRDIELVRSKYPEIPTDDWNDVIPSTKEVFTPFVVLPSEASELGELTAK